VTLNEAIERLNRKFEAVLDVRLREEDGDLSVYVARVLELLANGEVTRRNIIIYVRGQGSESEMAYWGQGARMAEPTLSPPAPFEERLHESLRREIAGGRLLYYDVESVNERVRRARIRVIRKSGAETVERRAVAYEDGDGTVALEEL